MPDWWPFAVAFLGQLLGNAFGIAWMWRGWRADMATLRADIAHGVSDAAEARKISEGVRSDQADLQTVVGIQGSKLATIESDMEAMRDALVNQIEAAVARGLRAR